MQSTVPTVHVSNDILILKSRYDRDLMESAHFLDMRWNSKSKIWYGKITKLFLRDFFKVFPNISCPPELTTMVSQPSLPPHTPSNYLLQHQLDSVIIASQRPRYCFFHGIGTGKTVLGIELAKQKKVKTLVVCGLSIIEDAWMADLRDLAPDVEGLNLWALRQRKGDWRPLVDKSELVVINFDSFRTIAEELQKINFQQLIVDESARLKDARTKTTKALIEFAENMDYCYLLSGNPAPNSELEYFNQVRAVEPTLFGRSFYRFRKQYFYSCGYGGFKWRMKSDMRDEFLKKLASVSEVIKREDVLDLPEYTHNIRRVFLDSTERKLYQDMEKRMYVELGGTEVLAVNAGVKLMKLREGTGGFYLDENGDPLIVGKSKFMELQELLEEIGNKQVIIWTHFHYEADTIEKILNYSKFGRVDGTIRNQFIKNETLVDFKNGRLQYLIAHPGSIGHGVRLENCSDAIFFSLSHSYELFDQSCGRIWRKGQKSKCSYYFLIADCSVDEVIFEALMNKEKVVEMVFNYIKKGKP
jgi:SNF2 family DNA or RNA helicase